MKIKRTAFDTSDLSNKALPAAQQNNSADVLTVDNPVVSTLAEAGRATTRPPPVTPAEETSHAT